MIYYGIFFKANLQIERKHYLNIHMNHVFFVIQMYVFYVL